MLTREPLITGTVMIGMENLMSSIGCNCAQLMRRVDMSREVLMDPQQEIPLRRFVGFMERAATDGGIQHLGLAHGKHFKPRDLGLFGYAIMSAGSLGDALRIMSEYISTVQDHCVLSFNVEGDVVRMTYRILDPALWPRRQDAEFSLALLCRIARNAAGEDWVPSQVEFEHAAPRSSEFHHRFFGCPMMFNMPTNALEFPADVLNQRMNKQDRTLSSLLEQHLGDIRAEREKSISFKQAVRVAISANLAEGGAPAQVIADAVGLTVQKLHRNLVQEGCTLRDLVRETRLNMARNYLIEGEISVTEIAYLLGYSDVTAFNRAFKSWTGKPPSYFRPKPPSH